MPAKEHTPNLTPNPTPDESVIEAALTPSTIRYAGGAVILLGLGVFIVWLAMAPMHAVSSADACDAAFKQARSRTDTIAAALLSFPDPTGHHVTRRCGERLAAPHPGGRRGTTSAI